MRKRLPATAHASREVSRTDQVKDPPSAVLRPLGAAEQLLWLLDQNSPRHFVLAAQIEGHIAIKGWRNAQERRGKKERRCMERSARPYRWRFGKAAVVRAKTQFGVGRPPV